MVTDIVDRYLHNAVKKQYQDLVLAFLRPGGMDINARDGYGMTALMWAVGRGYSEIAELLLRYGADIEARNDLLSVVSIEKLETGNGDYWNLIDQMGQHEARKHHGWTALVWAARNGHTDLVTLLLDQGANINAITKDGFTALSHAISKKHINTAHLLLGCGADPNLIEDGASPALPIAAGFGFVGLVQAILDHGGKIDALDNFGHSALGNAVTSNEPEVLKLLLGYALDANAICPGFVEWPPLHFAAECDALECAQILLDHGANINAKDELNAMTALEFALDEMVGPRVARLLIERGADLSGALERAEDYKHLEEAGELISLLKERAGS